MISYVTNKEEITRKILPLIDSTEILDFDYAMKTWWVNIRDTGGLCLTALGDKVFRQAKIECYDLILGWTNYSNAGMLMLDRKMPCPYHIHFASKQNFVRIYDSRVAMMITLHGGVEKFLKNKIDIHYSETNND
jgi:hypothetical protein